MNDTGCNKKSFLITAALGAIAGGIIVAVAAKAIHRMMAKMGEYECSPAEMRHQMMERFGEAQNQPEEEDKCD